MFVRPLIAIAFAAGLLAAQDAAPPAAAAGEYTVAAGTKLPLSLINSVSTKHSELGDRVYLETAFPILVNGRIVIPVGSWVMGTVTEVKKPGRVKGRGELYIRFDSLTLPNGVTREFRSRMGGMDAGSTGELDRAEGKVKSEGNKAGDVRTVAETTGAGASVGAIAGHGGMGLGIGAAAGAAGGLIYILASRGPDAIVAKGSTIEMVLDRAISFNEGDLDFTNPVPRPGGKGGA
jgi:type IV secretion system protein VirB10